MFLKISNKVAQMTIDQNKNLLKDRNSLSQTYLINQEYFHIFFVDN